MLRLSQLFEASNRRNGDAADIAAPSSHPSSCLARPPPPESPESMVSSNPGSPVTSLFSTRTHTRFPSSVSSLASSPVTSSPDGFGGTKTQLTEVKEEPGERESGCVERDGYFPHFNDFHAAAAAAAFDDSHLSLDSHDFDDQIDTLDAVGAFKKRRSDSKSLRQISRISTRFSSLSSKWKQQTKPSSIADTVATRDRYEDSLRSRANSATSALASPAASLISARQSLCAPSPARTTFEERLNEAGVAGLDIERANQQFDAGEPERHVRTPLLPPVMMDLPHIDRDQHIDSPLESPSIAPVADSRDTDSPPITSISDVMPPTSPASPITSAHPSMSSISRQLAMSRLYSTRMVMSDSVDEWSCKLGHANFTIYPEPYVPEICDREALNNFRANWELARCNYAKHLARTDEHYGSTSHIYKLTEEKWVSVNSQWKNSYNHVIANLEDGNGNRLSLSPSEVLHCSQDAVKIPGLHDKNKFPELGDEDIVGPMSVGPGLQHCRSSDDRILSKKSILKFLNGLFSLRKSS
ncbi:Only proline and serine are matching in the corresponding protein [Trichophyton interdigitale]|nr:Only proline and serine are matching in the corresponding protein [Trichophyton interdigitale]KAG5216562.1 Only proline and serine are matching in the corresponding protein [Trichophyton interdigitale]KAG8205142.1 Only proline and serine are matching in the corresponding protein [Trichophyton interdigitale]